MALVLLVDHEVLAVRGLVFLQENDVFQALIFNLGFLELHLELEDLALHLTELSFVQFEAAVRAALLQVEV